MITYLVSIGYSALHVGLARTVSTVFELSATWVAPRMIQRIGTVRGGIWSLSWQMFWLAGGLCWFFADFHNSGLSNSSSIVSATGLAVAVALSRVGLWGYDLCAQNIIQDVSLRMTKKISQALCLSCDEQFKLTHKQEVEPDYRGTFSTVEATFQNVFELLSYVSTIIFSRPDQFQWPMVISVAAVYSAGGLYSLFVRKRRGHLLHRPPCMDRKG